MADGPNVEIYRVAKIAAIILGFVSCSFAALTFLILLKMRIEKCVIGIRISSVLMLLSLVAADFLRGFFNLTGMIRYLIKSDDRCISDIYCKLQSFMSIWFNMIVFISIFFIGTLAIHQLLGGPGEEKTISNKTLWKITAFCWAIPFILTIIPAACNVLGEDKTSFTNGWCWITSCDNTSSVQRITFMILYSKGFEALTFIINLTLFIFLKYLNYTHDKRNQNAFSNGLSISAVSEVISRTWNSNIMNDSKLLFLVNISICFSRLWGLSRTILNISSEYNKSTQMRKLIDDAEVVLFVFQSIFDNLQSIFVFLVLLMCSNYAKLFMKQLICQCSFRRRIRIISF